MLWLPSILDDDTLDDSIFSDDDIILALQNENACNAALRSSARATIEFVERYTVIIACMHVHNLYSHLHTHYYSIVTHGIVALV